MKNFEESAEAFKRQWEKITDIYRKVYGIEEEKKPQNINEFLDQKKNRKPFYKDKNKKPWE